MAPDSTSLGLFVALIECDVDVYRVLMSNSLADGESEPYRELYGLTAEEAITFADCAAAAVLDIDKETLSATAAQSSDSFDFGVRVGELVTEPCLDALVRGLAVADAPTLDITIAAIIGDRNDWVVSDRADAGNSLIGVLVENNIVSAGIIAAQQPDTVLSVGIAFDATNSTHPLPGEVLHDIATLFGIQLDEARIGMLLQGQQELAFGDATICASTSGTEVSITVLPSALGCTS